MAEILTHRTSTTKCKRLRVLCFCSHLSQCLHLSFRFAVPESVVDGEVVGMVEATDADAGLAGRLRYRGESLRGDLPFRVLSNGSIVVTQSLDYEAQRRYVFNVTAMDCGRPRRNGKISAAE